MATYVGKSCGQNALKISLSVGKWGVGVFEPLTFGETGPPARKAGSAARTGTRWRGTMEQTRRLRLKSWAWPPARRNPTTCARSRSRSHEASQFSDLSRPRTGADHRAGVLGETPSLVGLTQWTDLATRGGLWHPGLGPGPLAAMPPDGTRTGDRRPATRCASQCRPPWSGNRTLPRFFCGCRRV